MFDVKEKFVVECETDGAIETKEELPGDTVKRKSRPKDRLAEPSRKSKSHTFTMKVTHGLGVILLKHSYLSN